MANRMHARTIREIVYGLALDVPPIPLPQSEIKSLFKIKNGRVIVTSIFGSVSENIVTTNNSMKFLYTSDKSGQTVDLCRSAVLNGTILRGQMAFITGDPDDTFQFARAEVHMLQQYPIMLDVGTIKFSCSANSTGKSSASILFMAYDENAEIDFA